jgi:hypothetical protein
LVSDDGHWAKVGGVRFAAAALEDLLWQVAACRAAMLPRRFATMLPGSRIALGAGVHIQREDEGSLVSVMHPGMGWVGARVDRAECRALIRQLRP